MRKKRRIASALLALAMLSGCGTAAPTPTEPPKTEEGKMLALVPLDDRPDNVECAEYIAEMEGYNIVTPDKDLYSTKLNNQPLNKNGTQYGNREKIYEWLLEMEDRGCDRYVISLDQLLSGGLVSSRAMTQSAPIKLPNGNSVSETEFLNILMEALSKDENNRVWLLDTVMRLAPTVGYLDWTAEDYDSIRAYASEPRQELSSLSAESVKTHYRVGVDGTEIDFESFGVSEDKFADYLSARERKLTLTDEMLDLVYARDNGIFRVLIGIDDSSEAESIQKNEITYLNSRLREGDALLSGVDDLEFKSICRMYLDDISWSGAECELRYFGGLEDEAACVYDYRPLSETVTEHLEFFDLHLRTTNTLQVLILTKPENERIAEEYCDQLINAINENQKNEIPTILIDASDQQYGNMFRDKLRKNADIGWLIGYAGFLDMAIVTGTALSRGIARYAVLSEGKADTASNEAYMRMMTDAVVRDFCYVGGVRAKVNDKVISSGGATANFYEPECDVDALTGFMSNQMAKAASPVVKNLEKSSFISSLDGYELSEWENVELSGFNFPWNRAFEIRMDVLIGNN